MIRAEALSRFAAVAIAVVLAGCAVQVDADGKTQSDGSAAVTGSYPGQTRHAGERCNTCDCDPARERWRRYLATDPAQCLTLDPMCPASTTAFSNGCGCGCEESSACPAWFDCMPPRRCDRGVLMHRCPYALIAY